MAEASEAARVGRVEFTGSRHELFLILIRGYALMLPTIGLYRFWQATWKRRFYWQNTVIDGEPLEYTGTATQLLAGFFFALAFFLPIYIALFVLSMQEAGLVVAGYAAIGAIVWFLMGYAIYRARDFRLSRTLWRGVRFDVRGNAWAYALRRFLWSALMLVTLGLIYPWMASSLWKYRWRNTWFGDRKFEIAGNWRAFAAYYYGAYVLNGVAILARKASVPEGRDVVKNIPGFADDQQRIVAATYDVDGGPVRVISAYIPNGQALDSDKFVYKLRWLEALQAWLTSEMAANPRLMLLGDFNIAPEDRDVHDPKKWEGQNLVSPEERAAFRAMQGAGLVDASPWRVFGAQSAGCAPIATAFDEGTDIVRPVRPTGIAKSLNIGNPADGPYALDAVRNSGGAMAAVDDEAMMALLP